MGNNRVLLPVLGPCQTFVLDNPAWLELFRLPPLARGEVTYLWARLSCDISRDGERFQVDFGARYRAANVEKHPSLEPTHRFSKNQKVGVAARSECGATAVWMSVKDVGPNCDV